MTTPTTSDKSPSPTREYREPSVIDTDSSDSDSHDSDQDAPYEEDSEYTVPLEGVLDLATDPGDKGKQRAQDEDVEDAEDGDEDEDMADGDEDGEYEHDEEAEDISASTSVSHEEVSEWARVQLKKLDTDIQSAKNKIKEIDQKKAKAEERMADYRTRFRLCYAEKKMGAHELDKIRKQQTDAEQAVKKVENELAKAEGRLTKLEAKRHDIEYDTVRKFCEAQAKLRPRKPRNLENRHFPPEHNLDSGDDSLSDRIREQEEKEEKEDAKKNKKSKKLGRACRRCRLFKKKCNFQPGDASCDKCAITGHRCRYKDPFSGDKQLRPWQLHDRLEELAAVKAELARFREKSAASIGAENPLSGITGYGPPTQKWARQNWALMSRGLLARPPVPKSTTPAVQSSSSPALGKRKAATESNDTESKPSQPAAKRPRQTDSNSSYQSERHYSFQNETIETLAGPSNANQTSPHTAKENSM